MPSVGLAKEAIHPATVFTNPASAVAKANG